MKLNVNIQYQAVQIKLIDEKIRIETSKVNVQFYLKLTGYRSSANVEGIHLT